MIEHLPQELFDTIVGHIFEPLQVEFPLRHNTSTLNCTLVNRAFSAPARRRLFSTTHISFFSTADATHERLQSFLDLLQISEDIVSHWVETLSLTQTEYPIFGENDILLNRIIHAFEKSTSLSQLCISANHPSSKIFGPLSRKAIQNLLPRISDISLATIEVPHDFFQNVQFFRTLRLEDARMNPLADTAVKFILPRRIDTLMVSGHRSRVDKWYEEGSTPLPGFRKVRFRFEYYPPNIIISRVLSNSTNTLTTLEMYEHIFPNPLPDTHFSTSREQTLGELVEASEYIDFGVFIKLTNLCLSLLACAGRRPAVEVGQLLNSAGSWLNKSSNQTSLVHIKITIIYPDWFPLYDDVVPSQVEPLEHLNPSHLRIKHPDLRSIAIVIPLSNIIPFTLSNHKASKEDFRKEIPLALSHLKSSLWTAILGSPGITDNGATISIGEGLGPNMENTKIQDIND